MEPLENLVLDTEIKLLFQYGLWPLYWPFYVIFPFLIIFSFMLDLEEKEAERI
jgi:hypothetical protein